MLLRPVAWHIIRSREIYEAGLAGRVF